MAAEADARKAVALLAAGATGIFERVAPLIPVFHAVSADPAGEVYRHSEQLRYDGYADVVRILAAKAPLRSDAASATDVVFALLSPDLYRTLTAERGWDARRWLDWVAPTLYEQLFGSGRPKKR